MREDLAFRPDAGSVSSTPRARTRGAPPAACGHVLAAIPEIVRFSDAALTDRSTVLCRWTEVRRCHHDAPAKWGQSGKHFPSRNDENAKPSRHPQALRGENLIERASSWWVLLSCLSKNDGRNYTW